MAEKEVVRLALEAQAAEDNWTENERQSLVERIDRAIQQVAAGKTYGPEQARHKLAALRETHLARLKR